MAVETRAGEGSASSLWNHHPFYLHIQVLFTALILLTGAALLWSNYQQGRSIILSAAEDAFTRIERESAAQLSSLRAPIEAVVEWLSSAPVTDAGSLEARKQSLVALQGVLDRQTRLEAVYVGYYNGDFLLLRALRTDAERKRFGAPNHAAYLLQSIENAQGRRAQFIVLDPALNEISRAPAPESYTYDPRSRPWFTAAMRTDQLVQTDPYAFFTTGVVGQTIARRAEHGRAVVGADVTLTQLSRSLAQARPTESSQLALINADGGVIAFSEPQRIAETLTAETSTLPRIAALSPALGIAAADSNAYTMRRTVDVNDREWILRVMPTAAQSGQQAIALAIAVPTDELLGAARALLVRNVWLTGLVLLLTVPFTWWISRRIASNLQSLTEQAAAIRRFDFTTVPALRTRVREIAELGDAMARMRETIRKFLDISKALSAERKLDRLIERVLEEAHAAAGADGSVLYLLDEQGATLAASAQTWRVNGTAALPPNLAMTDTGNAIVRAAIDEIGSRAHPLLTPRPAGLEFLDARFGAAPLLLVTVPLRNRSGGAIGVLCMFVERDAEAPSAERLALVEAFAGAGAVAIDNQRLLAAQKALLDALIRLIAGAIDAKSPYTGGHCERVPELTFMLTRAACEAKTGPFADFDLDEEGWEALKIASGLHDCGKVTTPEYVVDKATKLETLYDRIHEVRMRFEVLKRDAEIACLTSIAAGAAPDRARSALEAELRALDEEFYFVARCNTGGEFMAAEHTERLKRIATRTWQRTLDDRIGISWEESVRKARTPAPSLPVTERLLDDKPEHVIERGPADVMPADNPWGFKLDTPRHLYNRGELHNLTVARGTLTDEERYKINDHIVQTIVMLSQLPLPPHLSSVPELAGGHHEKMDGTGYPRRLRRNDMSVPARIMAIADIFEALTASDRPYKKGKMLSEAIAIMSRMKEDAHIDPDLFDLFLRSGIYLEYAKRYLKPEFIDEVDAPLRLQVENVQATARSGAGA